MKKRKLTLGIAGALVSIAGMSACNEVTYKDGVILSYKDSAGQTIDFFAKDLFDDYLPSSASAATVFNNVRDVLIRRYYELPDQANEKEEAKKSAALKVDDVRDTAQKNADSNGTSYAVEWAKLLESEGVENVDELTEKKLLEVETEMFNNSYYTIADYNKMRDGTKWESISTDALIEKYGPVSGGYLEEKLPYHVSHILVKLGSASNNEHTQDTISEKEARNLSAVVKEIAGVVNDESGTNALQPEQRLRFGTIAKELSEDDGSAAEYGNLGIMDKSTGFVQEFKLGLYAFDALYNKKTIDAAADSYRKKTAAGLLPSTDNAMIDGEAIKTDFENRGIGTIPYGVFVALGTDAVAKNPNLGYQVNENSALFYARNILFNKYMNSHQIAVITPTEIPYNQFLANSADLDAAWQGNDFANVSAIEADANGQPITSGTLNATYAALPGFQTDTKDVLPQFANNVLTNEKGQIIIAVRAGTSGYQGIHFIVADRSILDEYTAYDEDTGAFTEISEAEYDATKANSDVNSLSEYYTMFEPENLPSNDNAASSADAADKYYPYYKEAGASIYSAKSTFVNGLNTTAVKYGDKAQKVKDGVATVMDSNKTYMFEDLIVKGDVSFNTENETGRKLEELVTKYIKTTREGALIDSIESFDKDWRTYDEYLKQQDVERTMLANGSQELISEVCAIGYGTDDAKNGTGLWAKGGACYDGK